MNESISIETLTNTQSNLNLIPLSDETKFRLNKINKIKDYFNPEIQERKTMIKKLSKYISPYDNNDKKLIVLSAISGGIGIISFTSYWSSCRNSKCKFYFIIFFNHRNNKKTVKDNKKQKEKT